MSILRRTFFFLFAPQPHRQISGIYPHLAMFNSQNECGTGALVPWAGKLWVVTYSPHQPQGSDDRLYEIDPSLRQTIRPESIGGTPANRMIHRESNQLFIGPYAIDASGRVRAIPYTTMYGRPTGNARHLTDPAGKIYYASMEEGFYEVDTTTLAVTRLYEDANAAVLRKAANDVSGPLLPGYHGKGFYSGQGRVVYSNNGEVGGGTLPPDTPSGCLAEWDGISWRVIRRNQFTDVTGPGGIYGNPDPASDPIWAIGWDHRSLILMLLDHGQWHSYRLPKASHTYDGAHGWNTEWPRIRNIGESSLLMTMHGMFWHFPKTFSRQNSAGIAPRSSYLRVIGDFTRWQDHIVMGCDDTAKNEFFNVRNCKGKIAGPGQSHSNLWFLRPSQLDQFGPALGRGAVWVHDDVPANTPSEPYLFSGFPLRHLHLHHTTPTPLEVTIEIDRSGNHQFTPLQTLTVPPSGYIHHSFPAGEKGVWLRLKTNTPATSATAFLQYAPLDRRSPARPATPPRQPARSLLWSRSSLLIRTGPHLHSLDASLTAATLNDPQLHAWMQSNLTPPADGLRSDAASVLYIDESGRRWRLPHGTPQPSGSRIAREVSTERDLLLASGTFYELPSNNAGGIALVRPISTHHLPVEDFCSWRGFTVLAGIPRQKLPAGEFIPLPGTPHHLWLGASDDLWQFGKPTGTGSTWLNTPVQPDVPSDPFLFTGYDRKQITLSHSRPSPVDIRVDIDLTGMGLWVPYQTFRVPPGKPLLHTFPPGFNAYWLRTVALQAATATATLRYT